MRGADVLSQTLLVLALVVVNVEAFQSVSKAFNPEGARLLLASKVPPRRLHTPSAMSSLKCIISDQRTRQVHVLSNRRIVATRSCASVPVFEPASDEVVVSQQVFDSDAALGEYICKRVEAIALEAIANKGGVSPYIPC